MEYARLAPGLQRPMFFVFALTWTFDEEGMMVTQRIGLVSLASTQEQRLRIGAQTGGRVFLFLYTNNFWRDYERYKARGIVFVREPKREPYGLVAVFTDLYGNLWDLLEPSDANRSV